MRDRLLKVIGDIYDCASDPSMWAGCLSTVRELLRGTSVNLLYHDLKSRGGIQMAVGGDPELYRLYREYGHAIDPWALACRPGEFAAGRVVSGATVIDHTRLRKTEFYAAMGRRYETTQSMFGVLESSPHQSGVLSINRGDRDEEFEVRDARTLAVLMPHLRRALAIRQTLGSLAGDRSHILDAMDRLSVGVVLVDARARPIFVNRYAARLIEMRDGLAIDNQSVVADAFDADARLQRAIGSAIAVARREAFATQAGELLIPRAAGRPLHASVSPAGSRDVYGSLTPPAAALLVVVDPDARAWPLSERLRELLSLTHAEARVAAAMTTGRRVGKIADKLGVSRETVRAQSKRVLDKAGVRSRSAFIRLAATEALRPAASRDDE